ncbi:MAG: hypothetical protein ACREKH_01530, partial [Candidatus Rokuibacteriota bacterium]
MRRRQESEAEKEQCATLVDELEVLCGDGPPVGANGLELKRLSMELALAILDRAQSLWKREPRCSLALAETVLGLLEEPSGSAIVDPLRADLEARAHAFRANAQRILDDLWSAEGAFVAAQAALGRGSRDPRERALVLTLLATLRRDQRRFAESLRQCEQAAAIYRWVHEHHFEGRTLSLMAITQAYAGQAELAIPLAERAAALIDPQRDLDLAAGLEHNMVHFLCAAGRPEDARARLPRARRLAEAVGIQKELRGLRWIEGQIAIALGEREDGERLLLGVREEFIAARNLYDTALVSLELAAEYLDQGRTADAKRLAEETLPIFQSLEVHREA